ncbi:hypothetical protein [Collimonas sp.]|uniref:hypothetical protein n=1 Tax=Collimonas sp. TaxID=1963772 RepID=UPI002BFD7F29|nr:hypothetical protein [Collimonas sp.]HWX02248.1 hypothetical protein [Collimonas sp.]
MTGKTAFTGDVGQAVIGNVEQAPQLTNVMHLNVNTEKSKDEAGEKISPYQKSQIWRKALELASVTGGEPVAAYPELLDRFGVSRIEELPSRYYKSAKAMMERRIAAAKADLEATEPIEQAVAPKPLETLAVLGPTTIHAPAPCPACAEKTKANTKLVQTSIAFAVVTIMLAVGCGWLLYKMPTDSPVANAAQTETMCHNDSKTYSVGSTAKILNVGVKECVDGEHGPRWDDIQRPRTR